MENIISEIQEVTYVVRKGSQTLSAPFTARFLAEQALASLPPEQQQGAKVVPIAPDGKEVLFG